MNATRPCARAIGLAALLVACTHQSGGPAGGTRPIMTTAAITEADLRQRLFRVTDDSTMGRETGSKGAYSVTEYIAAEFKRLGLEPGGDNGGWFQVVPMWRVAVDPASRLSAGGTSLTVFRDFMPGSSLAPARVLNAAAVVYGGSIRDTTPWIPAASAAGKVVLIDVPLGTSFRAASAVGSRYRDAIALLVSGLEDVPAEQVARLREGRPVPDTSRNARGVPIVWVSRSAARTIMGADVAALAPGAAGLPLSGRFDYPRTPVAYAARNVVGILRGNDARLRSQYLTLTAHNDHVGYDHSPVDHDSLRAFNTVVRPMGADSPVRSVTTAEWARIRAMLDSLRRVNTPRLDSIRNGADDDGSGTASILEIAEAFALGGTRPKRSLIFVSHTGEEAGLLGSRWFGDHAPVPVDSIVGEIDQDMVGRGTSSDFPRNGTGAGSDTYLEVIGAKRISREFGEYLERANAQQPIPFAFDYTFDAPGHPLQYYCRADHYNYARHGIPAVAFSRGEHQDYHQVTDEAQYISYRDLQRVSKMVFDAAMLIGNAAERPKRDGAKPTDPNAPCRQWAGTRAGTRAGRNAGTP
ncbi:MAG: M28 family peptidase [Gemmatimonadaceae bacterium]|nr:M28 family peptidase [Gemmatimonadaceae bacterium]